MASKRHSGLGRGLDALFPPSDENIVPENRSEANEVNEVNEVNDVHHVESGSDSKSTSYKSTSYHAQADNQKEGSASVGQKGSSESRGMGLDRLLTSASSNLSSDRGVVMVRLSRIEPNRKQPRQYFDEESMEELAQSIRQYGLLQPILVQDRDTHYEIIAGERRWRAARKAGLREVPVIIRNYSDQEITELSLIENIQREDLNPIEEARAYQMLINEYHLKQEDVAQRVSKSRTSITNTMRLLKLDEQVQDMVISGELSMGQARALLSIDDKEKQRMLAEKIAEQKLSVREVEKLVKHFKANQTDSSASKRDRKAERDEQLTLIYSELENRLKTSLNTKVKIHPGKGSAGKLEIEYYSSDDLERIADRLIRS